MAEDVYLFAGLADKAKYFMRQTWLLTWLILAVLPSWAAKRMNVAQLEHLLSADVAARKQDTEIAKQIAGIELADRISPAAFARLAAPFYASPLIY